MNNCTCREKWLETQNRWHRPLNRKQRLCSHLEVILIKTHRFKYGGCLEWHESSQREQCIECLLTREVGKEWGTDKEI